MYKHIRKIKRYKQILICTSVLLLVHIRTFTEFFSSISHSSVPASLHFSQSLPSRSLMKVTETNTETFCYAYVCVIIIFSLFRFCKVIWSMSTAIFFLLLYIYMLARARTLVYVCECVFLLSNRNHLIFVSCSLD